MPGNNLMLKVITIMDSQLYHSPILPLNINAIGSANYRIALPAFTVHALFI